MGSLTDDELLQLVRRGVSDADIGRVLGVEPERAGQQVDAALRRQGLRSRAEAVIAGVLAHGRRAT